MTPKCKQTIAELIGYFGYNCNVNTFKSHKGKCWEFISMYQFLSEDFMREFAHKISWYWIPVYQKLSENFMIEYHDKIDWWQVSRWQKMSESFLLKFQHKISWAALFECNHLVRHFNFSDDFYIECTGYADMIRESGTVEEIEKLEEIENRPVDRTYDIIL